MGAEFVSTNVSCVLGSFVICQCSVARPFLCLRERLAMSLSTAHHVSLFLSLGGLGLGVLFIIILIQKMTTNKRLAFRGN